MFHTKPFAMDSVIVASLLRCANSFICVVRAVVRLFEFKLDSCRLLAGLLGAASVLPVTNALAQTYSYQSQFGGAGSGNGQFNLPFGIAIDPISHNVLVTDDNFHNFPVTAAGIDRVQIFNSSGVFIQSFGTTGSEPGEFRGPRGIAFDPWYHNIIVVDAGNNRGQIFDSAGNYLSLFHSQIIQPFLNYPNGVAIDPVTHNIIIADAGSCVVEIFDSDGIPRGSFCTRSAASGQIGYLKGVAIDPISRNIVVADQSLTVQIFDAAGNYLTQFGTFGTGNGQFMQPVAVAVDPGTRNIAVVDGTNNRVQIFTAGGIYLSQFGSGGRGNGQFHGPSGIAIDPANHNIVVVDSGNHRVQIFAPTAASACTQATVYRYRNTQVLGHFLTTSLAEGTAAIAAGVPLQLDGAAFNACTGGSTSNGVYPVYRFRSLQQPGVYFYSMLPSEIATVVSSLSNLLQEEGIAFYALNFQAPGAFPTYRFRNLAVPGANLYTISEAEKAAVIANVPFYAFEGIGFFAMPPNP